MQESSNPPQGWTRRETLAGGARMAAGAGSLGLTAQLLAACGDDSKQESTGKPVRGGAMVYAMQTSPPGLDPHKWWNGAAFVGTANIYEGLMAQDPYTGKIGPRLAVATPEPTRGGTTYTFQLQKGVKFHDGSPLTPADVKYSLERLLSPATAAETGSLYQAVPIVGLPDLLNEKSKTLSGITISDPDKITVELEAPDSSFLPLLTYASAAIVPQKVVEAVGDKKFNWAPVGTGPFKAERVQPGRRVLLARNPKYWKSGVPYLDSVLWNMGVDPELSVLRIQRGQQDLMFEAIPAGALSRLQGNAQTKELVSETTVRECQYLTLNVKHPALSKLQVRQAIAMAIDKDRLIRSLRGLGKPGTGGVFSPTSPYYQEGLAYEFDQAKAKQLMADAGYSDGFDVTLYGQNTFPWQEMGQVVQQDLRAIGVRVDFKPLTYDAFVALSGKSPAAMLNFLWDLPYAHGSYIMDGAFTSAAIKAGCCNYASFSEAKLDDLAKQGHAATDPDEITKIYKEMDKIVIRDQAVWVPLVYPVRTALRSKRTGGFQVSPYSGSDQWQWFDKYWVAT